MPHIHTEPGQHDITVSAYVVRTDQEEPLCLVHMHRKIGKLMQIGGHIELTETPWQTVGHEVPEETGFTLDELKVAQHSDENIEGDANIYHPTPFTLNTHNVGNGHYHTALCYGFTAEGPAKHAVAAGESDDQRWLTLAELRALVQTGDALADVYNVYEFFVRNLGTYALISATEFSLDNPTEIAATYKIGAPGE